MKKIILTHNGKISGGKKSGEWASRQKKKRTRQKELWQTRQKNKREGIVKWNQMTALGIQTGGTHQTSPASLRGNAPYGRNNCNLQCRVMLFKLTEHRIRVRAE